MLFKHLMVSVGLSNNEPSCEWVGETVTSDSGWAHEIQRCDSFV